MIRAMGTKGTGIPAIAWLEPGQTELVRALASAAGIRVVAAGSPPASRRSVDGPTIEGAETITDLRQAFATAAVEAAILAAGIGSAEAPLSDADVLRAARSRGIRLVTVEPIPGSVADARSADATHWRDAVRFIALFREAPALATMDELLGDFGTPRTLSVSFRSGRGEGSLGARLFDAMHTVHSFLGAPESIDASIVTQVAASGLRLEPGESLRALRGDLTANLRFAGAKSAALSLSDRAGRWFRGVTMVGESGCIRMDEASVERVGEDGKAIDESPLKGKKRRTRAAPADAAALEDAARRATDPHSPPPQPFDLETVLAMCEAAILSARTGQPESPGTVLRMA
jgi:hypothetical protein